MARDRYKEIKSILHFCDNEKMQESTDKFYKVKLLIDTLNKTFKETYELGRHVSYDEMTIESSSRYIPSIQFNPLKPHKWGLKLHSVNCGVTGYCHKFEVYADIPLIYICIVFFIFL